MFARRTALLVLKAKKGNRYHYVTAYLRFGAGIDGAACRLADGAQLRTGHRPAAAAVVPGSGGLVLVANWGESTLSLLDLTRGGAELHWDADPTTRSRGAPLGVTRPRVGRGPVALAVRAAGDLAAVAHERDDSVSLVDLANLVEVARVPVGRRPAAVAFSKDGLRVFVANRLDDTVSEVDVADPAAPLVTATVEVEDDPVALAVSPGGSRLYVVCARLSSQGENGVLELRSASDLALRSSVEVGRAPWSVAASLDGTRAFVTNRRSGTVAVLDVVDGDAPFLKFSLAAGKNPGGAAVDPADGRVAFALSGEDGARVYSRSCLDTEKSVFVPGGRSPVQVLFTEDGATLLTVDAAGGLSVAPAPVPTCD